MKVLEGTNLGLRFLLELSALAAAGQRTLAVAFAIVAALSGTLNYLWD